jgi:hypothetical protein
VNAWPRKLSRVLIFDRDTYELLGENERLLERKNYVDGDPGELVGGSAVIESGVVDSITALPPAG